MKVYLVKYKDTEHDWGVDDVISAYSNLEKAETRLSALMRSLYEDRFDYVHAVAFIKYIDENSICNDENFMEKLAVKYDKATRTRNEIRDRYAQYNVNVLDIDYYIDELEVEE